MYITVVASLKVEFICLLLLRLRTIILSPIAKDRFCLVNFYNEASYLLTILLYFNISF